MCRHTLYFKGMHKVVDAWETERFEKKNEEAFSQAFDDIFEAEESDGGSDGNGYHTQEDSDTDSDWETSSEYDLPSLESEDREDREDRDSEFPPFRAEDLYSEYVKGEIILLQKEYKKAMELGLDFEWYHENSWFFEIEPPQTVVIEDDVFPHFKNLFVSNHKSVLQGRRVGKRVPPKTDASFTTVLVFVM
jgi:hypothetical protein